MRKRGAGKQNNRVHYLARSVSLALALSAPTVLTVSAAHASSPQRLVRDTNLASSTSLDGASYLGSLAAGKRVTFDVVLAPANPQGLQRFVNEVSSPSSPLYHHFLTERAFAQRFGPRKAVVGEASAWLAREGFSVSRRSTFVIKAEGTVRTTSHALGLSLGRYRLKQAGTGILAAGAPILPARLEGQVTGIVGLDTLEKPVDLAARPMPGPVGSTLRRRLTVPSVAGRAYAAQTPGPGTACSTASEAASSDGAYTINQLSTLYQLSGMEGAGEAGAGVTVALPEVGAISSSDVAAFDQCYGLTTQPAVVEVDGGANSQVGPAEADLDYQEMAVLAPAASISVYEGPNTLGGLYDMVDQIVAADQAKVISLSLGLCEGTGNIGSSYENSMQALLDQAASQGQSVLAGSGDTGSEDCLSYSAGHLTSTSLSTDYPASSPEVTSVGGTVATTTGELAWDDCNGTGNSNCATILTSEGGVGASGGGVSNLYKGGPQGQPVLAGTGGYREEPDVSANAGSNYGYGVEFYIDGQWQPYIGTSLATPLWGALVADRDSQCRTSTGDFNPALYSLYATAGQGYGVAFNAIDQGYVPGPGFRAEAGTNDYTQSNGGAYAVASGYNMVTGIGSPIGTGLACTEVSGDYEGAPGQQVTVDGVGLEDATISFGAQGATVVAETGTSATVVVPPAPAGVSQVAVSASSLLGESLQGATFTYASGQGPTTTTTTTTVSTTTTSSSTTTSTTTSTIPTPTSTTSPIIGGGGGGAPPPAPPPALTTTTTAYVASPVTSTTQAMAPTTTTTVPATTPGQSAHRPGHGYWLVDRRGQVFSFGLGKAPAAPTVPSAEKVVAIAPTPNDEGYWLVAADGKVFVAGNAKYYGDIPGLGIGPVGSKAAKHLSAPIVGLVPSVDGRGYILVGADGGLFSFGDARPAGSCAQKGHCAGPVVAAVADATGSGYWLVTASGHIYSFGHARALAQCVPVVSSARSSVVAATGTPTGKGLWVLLANGSVCHVGNAAVYHQTAGPAPKGPDFGVGAAIVALDDGPGYWVVTSTGRALCYGAAPRVGDLAGHHLATPLVAAAGW